MTETKASLKQASYLTEPAAGLEGIRQMVGSHDAGGFHFGIAVARFNRTLTESLLRHAVQALREHGVQDAQMAVAWVPGTFELPLAIRRLARTGRYHALLALGVVIEGDTPHADLITREATHAFSRIAQETEIPVLDGVVAARNLEQAQIRSLEWEHSRGRHAALAALEMANLLSQMS